MARWPPTLSSERLVGYVFETSASRCRRGGGETMQHRTRRAVPRELSRPEVATAKRLRSRSLGDGEGASGELARLRARCAELEVAIATKDQALALTAHDLRAPLNAILGWTELVETGVPGVTDRALTTIKRNARAAGELVEELLHGASSTDHHVTAVDLRALAAATVDGALPAAERAEVTLRLHDEDDGKALVLANPRDVARILQNLVGNALKYTPPGGRVDVMLRPFSGVVELVVRDDGRGIDPALLPHVFERGTQDEDARAKGQGFGLGLFIVRRLVARQGGTVGVTSGPGGTTFTVVLPKHL